MKKQITIDGEKSDWYEKAIFILKENEKACIPDNLFLYAEDIVETHLKKNAGIIYANKEGKKATYKKNSSDRARKIDRFFNISLVLCGISIIVLTVILLNQV